MDPELGGRKTREGREGARGRPGLVSDGKQVGWMNRPRSAGWGSQPYFSGIRVLGSQGHTRNSHPLGSRNRHSRSCRRRSSWGPSDREGTYCHSGYLRARVRLGSVVRGEREKGKAVERGHRAI